MFATIAMLLGFVGCRRGGGSKAHVELDAGRLAPRVHASANLKAGSEAIADNAPTRGKVVELAGAGPDDTKLAFIDNRVAKGAAGIPEIVSLRVWHCGPSCTCPPPCLQTASPGAPARWLDVVNESGDPVVLPDWASADVTGRFTGRTRTAPDVAADAGDGGPTLVPELRLVGAPAIVATGTAPELEGAQAKVVLDGASATKIVSKIKDERPFLVIAGAFALSDPRSEEEAGKLYQRLDALGFRDAERHDSRAFAELACCFELVVAGRFADAKAAAARQRLLAARGLKSAYVKRGF